MVRRSTRWRTPPPKILSTPDSKRVVRCYACQGKAYIFHPLAGEPASIILVNSEREVRIVKSASTFLVAWGCEIDVLGEWRVLGWIPPGGELRHGELEDVDPDVADWDQLPLPNRQVSLGAPSRPNAVKEEIDIVPWDENGDPEY